MSSQNNGQKKKKGGGGAALFVLLILLLPRLFELLDDVNIQRAIRRLTLRMEIWMIQHGMDPELLPLIAVGVLVVIVLLIGAAKRRKKAEDRPIFNSAGGRTSAAKQRPDPRNRSFTTPEASCIVCDHTGEDHFVRDKAQRIAQLDEWLKNGLIDREEYRVLKSRYERDL